MAELYTSIGELIKKEKKAANYCFDEEWLSWLNESADLDDEIRGVVEEALSEPDDRRSIAIACAAVEIGEKLERGECFCGYASDSGDVQRSMYEAMFERDCEKCEGTCGKYSMDILTNFVYTFKRSIKILEHTDNIWCSGNTGGFDNASCFTVGYREIFISALGCFESNEFVSELNQFARVSSVLGNYGCIPCQINGQERINSRKGNAWGTLKIVADDGNMFYVSDQFALFLKWIEQNKNRGEDLKAWEETMRFSCWKDVYSIATKRWETAYFLPDGSEEKLSEFKDYISLIRQVTAHRSDQIARML